MAGDQLISAMDAAQPLCLEGITCEFPGVKALDDITIAFQPGEIHAITGENGAGKSTLLKVLSGTVSPVSGIIRIGQTFYPAIRDALSLGIRAIPQEPLLAQNLSIGENIHLGVFPRRRSGLIDWKQVFKASRVLLQRVGLRHLRPEQLVRGLGVGEQQLIQTARCLAGPGSIFLFDEPTTSLAGDEVDRLFEIIRDLAGTGVIVLYVSHRVPELFRLCHRATVLRDGRLIGSKLLSETEPNELIHMMVGRNLVLNNMRTIPATTKVALEVWQVRPQRRLPPISFKVNHGEILGIAGLVGSGRTELLNSIFGIGESSQISGGVLVDEKRLQIRSPKDAVSGNIAYVPADRKRDGLVIQLNVDDNLALPNLAKLSRFGFLRVSQIKEMASKRVAGLGLKTAGLRQKAGMLSGGNQQKVVLGKWLERNPTVLLLDEPTRGVDVAAKAEIYTLIQHLASSGMAVVISSSEMPELIGLCQRILVMCEGHLTAELCGNARTEKAILRFATPGVVA